MCAAGSAHRGLAEQFEQAIDGFGPVVFLGAKAPGPDPLDDRTVRNPQAGDDAGSRVCVKGYFRGIFVDGVVSGWLAAAYWINPWPRFREITLKSLNDDHTTRFASQPRRLRHGQVRR